MAITSDGIVRVPKEYAQHLSELALEKGTTESALVEEALALLFSPTIKEREILRGLIEDSGPSEAHVVPTLSSEDIIMAIPVPVDPRQLFRASEEC